MNRGIKNWMIVSVALALAESGALLGGQFHWLFVEWIFDAAAMVLVIIVVIRYFWFR